MAASLCPPHSTAKSALPWLIIYPAIMTVDSPAATTPRRMIARYLRGLSNCLPTKYATGKKVPHKIPANIEPKKNANTLIRNAEFCVRQRTFPSNKLPPIDTNPAINATNKACRAVMRNNFFEMV